MISRLAKITLFLFASGVFFFASDQVVSGQSAQCCNRSIGISVEYGVYGAGNVSGGSKKVGNEEICNFQYVCGLTGDSLLGLDSQFAFFSDCKNEKNKILPSLSKRQTFLLGKTEFNDDFVVRISELMRFVKNKQEYTNALPRVGYEDLNLYSQIVGSLNNYDFRGPPPTVEESEILKNIIINVDDEQFKQNCLSQFNTKILEKMTLLQSHKDLGLNNGYLDLSLTLSQEEISCTANNMCREALGGYTEDCRRLSTDECTAATAQCKLYRNNCYSVYDPAFCSVINEPDVCNSVPVCAYNPSVSSCLSKLESGLIGNQTSESAVLPKCALAGSCRSVEDLLVTAVRLAKEIFGVIGAAAFAMFIYGGGLMVASFGNEERFTKGKQALTAAVIGLIIAFSAYLLVGYVLSLFEVGSSFNIYEINANL